MNSYPVNPVNPVDNNNFGFVQQPIMFYLYASKAGVERKLVATFSSEQQLLAYARWATLESTGERRGKFEQGSVLAGASGWELSAEPLTAENAAEVAHNPTPSML